MYFSPSRFAFLLLLCGAACALDANAQKKTVCTITVNSADEKEMFRSRLPAGDYSFVELVEKGREDWLGASCRKGVQCDVLVVSGHFNAGDTFYSDNIAKNEYLGVDELERAACSGSCPALFSKLKEVYLFGCESLNPDATKYSSSYGESGRDRMRRIFAGVPVIYGFSGAAPVGSTAAALLDRYFDTGARSEIASGRRSSRLLSAFSSTSMTTVGGVQPGDTDYAQRQQVCKFFDERLTPAKKLAMIHDLMRRDMAGARAYFKRIERLLSGMSEAERQDPAFTQALAEISADDAARTGFLAMARSGNAPALRGRMIGLADTLGWLTPQARVAEQTALVNDILASGTVGFAEVDLLCTLNKDGALDGARTRINVPPAKSERAAYSAALACLGDDEAHGRVVRALASTDERDVQVAQAYLRNRPLNDPKELRGVARDIARMPGPVAQVRALDALGRLDVSDRVVVEELVQSYTAATSINVQRAIAEIFIRSGAKSIARPELATVLQKHRLRPPNRSGEDLIDVLIRRLQSS